MHLQDKASRMMEQAKGVRAARKERVRATPEISDWEFILQGFVEGMSNFELAECQSGLTLAIKYFFDAYSYKEVYNPQYTIKFMIASQKFNECTNIVYA